MNLYILKPFKQLEINAVFIIQYFGVVEWLVREDHH
jgi:hypothetical protein